jgi:hypothetical protein
MMLRRLAFYVDMLEMLSAAGVGKPAWVPPLQFADELARRRPEAAALVRELTSIFYAGRYGGRALGREDSRRVAALLERLPAALQVQR